ncbi:MAG: NAD(P)/FAD-dependent oxidoreductase [Pseudomonadota bacterium]
MDKVDCVVIGAGVVGLAVAARLARDNREVLVLEQHDLIGSETSSRNSEVIHAGIYYPANSAKARLCVRGKAKLYEYCAAHGVPHQRCGKIIVAAEQHQVDTVTSYLAKAAANGVHDLRWLDAAEIAELEPEVRSVGGVLSPSTGIIDSHAYMLALQGELEARSGMVVLNTRVERIEGAPLTVHTADMSLACDWLINAAGLHAPGLAAQVCPAPSAFYAKGHYYAYSGAQPFQRLVYPVAEAGGLGVHVTLDLAGQVKFGPDVRWQNDMDYSFDESHFDDFLKAIKHYFPAVDAERLHPSYTGIRPKLAPAGSPFEDFRIYGPDEHGIPGCVHLLGIESPGLTASLAIADEVSQSLLN